MRTQHTKIKRAVRTTVLLSLQCFTLPLRNVMKWFRTKSHRTIRQNVAKMFGARCFGDSVVKQSRMAKKICTSSKWKYGFEERFLQFRFEYRFHFHCANKRAALLEYRRRQ